MIAKKTPDFLLFGGTILIVREGYCSINLPSTSLKVITSGFFFHFYFCLGDYNAFLASNVIFYIQVNILTVRMFFRHSGAKFRLMTSSFEIKWRIFKNMLPFINAKSYIFEQKNMLVRNAIEVKWKTLFISIELYRIVLSDKNAMMIKTPYHEVNYSSFWLRMFKLSKNIFLIFSFLFKRFVLFHILYV